MPAVTASTNPLFRRFPEEVPDNTAALWWKKVVVHFLQAEGQPCLFCGRTGSTHVLQPCWHVVCDHCFDGANYSACPSCEHHVDRSSPFFKPADVRELPKEKVTFKRLDLGASFDEAAKGLLVSLCLRKQALSPVDREALATIVREFGARVIPWLPTVIPVRENVACVFGTLFTICAPADVLLPARRYLGTATDVLRLIAVMSGTDGSLQRETIYTKVEAMPPPSRFWGKIAALFGQKPPSATVTTASVPLRVHRFKVARMSRPLRRALLGMLEGLDPDLLLEDMLRHRSYWVWVGEFLHPHEHAARFPNVTRAFQVVRQHAPGGAPAPRFQGWNSRVEQALNERDVAAAANLLIERPGEFARRLDHLLRLASADAQTTRRVLDLLASRITSLATPVLVTLRAHLPTRYEKAGIRVYWPKGRVARGVSGPDRRSALSSQAIARAVEIVDAELLRRLGEKPAFETCIIDETLRNVIVPFNERTASPSAVALPRGSRIVVPLGKVMRLFLHWCQPQTGGWTTDLDLSVGFYDDEWRYVGVCSYYELKMTGKSGAVVAQSAGDLQDAPWPDGATEFVDLHRDRALAEGIRYAVMVVNAYAGMTFAQLERGFAGLMLRDDVMGSHFDPRTVELKFALEGDHGIFMPLVLDVREGVIHWLDVHSKGQLQFNNVATSNGAITKICPELMTYFGSGARASMYQLALLHAAARCRRVLLRGEVIRRFERRADEDVGRFHARLLGGKADAQDPAPPPSDGAPLMAILQRGDLALPQGSAVYALFREQVVPTLAASDLLS